MTEEPQNQFVLPGSTLTYTEPPKSFPVSHKDWQHLRGGIEGIRFPLRWAENVMWIAIPLVPAAGLALLTWLPVYDALSMTDQNRWNWVTPAIIFLGISALGFAIYSGLVAKGHRVEATHDVTHVLADMDEMYRAGNPPTVAATGGTEDQSSSAAISSQVQT